MTDTVRGIDASTFQNVIDWAAVKASGLVQFAYARATDGPFYMDPTFERNHDVARERDIPIGSYHFFRFNADPIAQARHFVTQSFARGRLGSLLPMIDVEEESFDGPMDYKAALNAISNFVHTVIGLCGIRTMILYTNYDTWNTRMQNAQRFANLPLWLAQTLDPRTGLFGGWADWFLWQDSTETVPGITGPVDFDLLNPQHTLKDITR